MAVRMATESTGVGMRRGRGIRIIAGDKVEVEVSAYDPTKGRIVWRHR